MTKLKPVLAIVLAGLLASCAESPTGRRQVLLFSDGEMSQMGGTAFEEMKKKMTINRDGATNKYVSCIADAITASLPAEWRGSWEVVVFEIGRAHV